MPATLGARTSSLSVLILLFRRKQENAMLESVRKTHPRKTPPCVIDLTKDLPSPRELESSYIKLRDLCTPGNDDG